MINKIAKWKSGQYDMSEDQRQELLRYLEDNGYLFSDQIPGYALHKEGDGSYDRLGNGSFGTVYRCVGPYVIKVIGMHNPPMTVEELRKAEREIVLQAQLKEASSNIVSIIFNKTLCVSQKGDRDFAVTEWHRGDKTCDPEKERLFIFILMEYLEPVRMARTAKGELAAEPLQLQGLPEPEVIRYILDIGSALEAIHKKGLIHRDVKPDNTFWDPAAKCYKLGDFGIAGVLDNKRTLTAGLGTERFRAPEVLYGDYDCRADVYSLGVTLYWMLNELSSWSQTREALPLPNGLYSVGLRRIACKACSQDPEKRYATVTQMLEQLRALEAPKAVQSQPAQPAPVKQPAKPELTQREPVKQPAKPELTAKQSQSAPKDRFVQPELTQKEPGQPKPAAAARKAAAVPKPAAPKRPGEEQMGAIWTIRAYKNKKAPHKDGVSFELKNFKPGMYLVARTVYIKDGQPRENAYYLEDVQSVEYDQESMTLRIKSGDQIYAGFYAIMKRKNPWNFANVKCLGSLNRLYKTAGVGDPTAIPADPEALGFVRGLCIQASSWQITQLSDVEWVHCDRESKLLLISCRYDGALYACSYGQMEPLPADGTGVSLQTLLKEQEQLRDAALDRFFQPEVTRRGEEHKGKAPEQKKPKDAEKKKSSRSGPASVFQILAVFLAFVLDTLVNPLAIVLGVALTAGALYTFAGYVFSFSVGGWQPWTLLPEYGWAAVSALFLGVRMLVLRSRVRISLVDDYWDHPARRFLELLAAGGSIALLVFLKNTFPELSGWLNPGFGFAWLGMLLLEHGVTLIYVLFL